MIVGISGKKQAGKNTAANVLHGMVLDKYNLSRDWVIDQDGKLNVLTSDRDGKEGWGEFDVSRKDQEFADYAQYNMWPYVKLYSFADSLKWMAVNSPRIPLGSAALAIF